ncbi:hypothetical protein JCM11641_001871 [Rhodosporidiobolus odoratus]
MPKDDRSDAQPGRNKPYSRPNQSRPRSAHYDHASSSQSRRPYNPSNQHSDAIVKPPRPQKVVKPPKQQSQSLDLSNSPLTAPRFLDDHPKLSKLNLTNTTVDSIAFVATVASTLTWLNVSGNDLSQDGAWNGIDQLKTLFVLNASHCSLTVVPSCVASLSSLKALVLSHNSLTRLEHIVNLPDLNTIGISAFESLARNLKAIAGSLAAALGELSACTRTAAPTLASTPTVSASGDPEKFVRTSVAKIIEGAAEKQAGQGVRQEEQKEQGRSGWAALGGVWGGAIGGGGWE